MTMWSTTLTVPIIPKRLQSLPEGALRKLHLHFCYHLKEVRIVALPFYLYNMRLEEYVATK